MGRSTGEEAPQDVERQTIRMDHLRLLQDAIERDSNLRSSRLDECKVEFAKSCTHLLFTAHYT